MTGELLEGIAAQALNLAKLELDRHHALGLFIASYFEGEGLRRMKSVEDLLKQKFGDRWLDDGRMKDLAFPGLRLCLSIIPPDAIVFVTAANFFVPTEKLAALDPQEQERITESDGHRGHHRAVKNGYLKMREGLQAVVQTPELVCLRMQPIESGEFLDQPETKLFPQSEFSGRLKMFGEERTQ